MSRSTRRSLFLILMVLTLSAFAGGMLGKGVKADAQPTESRLRTFGQVMALLEDHFVGDLESHDLVESAIQGMLQTLDPHSNYLTRNNFSEMKDEQRGKFFGLGIQINKPGPDRPLTIIAPIEDTPAFRVGLHAGDIIYKIEGEETSDLTLHQAVRKLKGDRGTEVTVTIQRPSEGSAFDVTLVRDEIPTHSIRVSFMIRPEVGYIRISNFTSTTAEELDEALRTLGEQGMTKLVLDLRSNPGGLLDQAVEVSKRFLPSGKLLVFTRGRVRGSDEDYVASNHTERFDASLVVLLDRHSASASEIVAGAIQDHDRGLLVGERSFGKGLVQRVVPLRNGGAVALTTAKYYTPSGRLIQRDYTDLDDYFLDPRNEEETEDTLRVAPEEPIEENREVFYTDAGREVYGGGGITPDYIVPSMKLSTLLSRLLRQNMIFDYAVQYAEGHTELEKGFTLDDPELKPFKAFLEAREFGFSEEAFHENLGDIRRRIRAQVAKVRWGESAESLILMEGDTQIQKALILFEEAAQLATAGEEGVRRRKAELRPPKPSI